MPLIFLKNWIYYAGLTLPYYLLYCTNSAAGLSVTSAIPTTPVLLVLLLLLVLVMLLLLLFYDVVQLCCLPRDFLYICKLSNKLQCSTKIIMGQCSVQSSALDPLFTLGSQQIICKITQLHIVSFAQSFSSAALLSGSTLPLEQYSKLSFFCYRMLLFFIISFSSCVIWCFCCYAS